MPDPTPETARIANDPVAIQRVRDRLVTLLQHQGFSDSETFAVRLAFEEAISNAFRHGHCSLPTPQPVEVSLRATEREVWIAVQDAGPGFDPRSIPDPTAEQNLEKPSGRGLMLMRAYMTEVRYVGRGNRVEMTYRRSPP